MFGSFFWPTEIGAPSERTVDAMTTCRCDPRARRYSKVVAATPLTPAQGDGSAINELLNGEASQLLQLPLNNRAFANRTAKPRDALNFNLYSSPCICRIR